MKQAKVIEQKDIKKILAEKFGVDENNVIKAQYSYIIIEGSEENEDEQTKRTTTKRLSNYRFYVDKILVR